MSDDGSGGSRGRDELKVSLDKPLFKRDERMVTTEVPVVKALVWDNVYSPNGAPLTGPVPLASTEVPVVDPPASRWVDQLEPEHPADFSAEVDAVPGGVADPLDHGVTTAPPVMWTGGDTDGPPTTDDVPIADSARTTSTEHDGSSHHEPDDLGVLLDVAGRSVTTPVAAPRDDLSDLVDQIVSRRDEPAAVDDIPVDVTAPPQDLRSDRDIDPNVAGAAVRVTAPPAPGTSRSGRDVVVHDDGDTGAVEPEPAATPAASEVDPPAESEPSRRARPVRPAREVNRLFSTPVAPDSEEIDLPPIAFANGDPISTSSAAIAPAPVLPRLSDSPLFAPKQPPPIHTLTQPAPTFTITPPARRRKVGSIVRTALSILLILGVVGGGLYAVKRYVLDTADWQADVEGLADEVAAARGLDFNKPVLVDELPLATYASLIVERTIPIVGRTDEETAGTLRALGLLDGDLTERSISIGSAAALDSPAMYDPSSGRIEVVAGLDTSARTFAIQRALGVALLHQHRDWLGDALDDGSPAARTAALAVADADALATAWSLVDSDAEVAAIQAGLFRLAGETGTEATPSSYLSALIGRPGLALRPLLAGSGVDERDALTEVAQDADGAVFDGARPLTTDVGDAVGSSTRGLLFWYSVLATRIEPAVAWSAALEWVGDSMTVTSSGGRVCVDAQITTAGPPRSLGDVAQLWAVAAPASTESTATVLDSGVRITACDPGADGGGAAPLPSMPLGGGALEAIAIDRALVDAGATAAVDRSCLTVAIRGRGGSFNAPAEVPPIFPTSPPWSSPWVDAHRPTADEIAFCGG